MVIKSETNFLYVFCLPQMLLNLRHFNTEASLDCTNSYYLTHLDEIFLRCTKVLIYNIPLHLSRQFITFFQLYIKIFNFKLEKNVILTKWSL